MHFKMLILSGAAVLALAGCATSTSYHPADGPRGTGYSDERLADNRFRVTFTGNSATRRETVENFLMLRAAEVTQKAGFDWFVFDSRDTEAKTTYHTDFVGGPGWGPGFGRRFGWYRHNWAYDPWDPYWQTSAFPTTRYQAYAEIVLLTPEQAKADPHALRAGDVIARLGPAAAPPPPANP